MVSQHNTKRAVMERGQLGAGTAESWMTSQDASKRETLVAVQKEERTLRRRGFAE